MNLTLIRDTADREVTLGRLTVNAGLVLDTLELPWVADPQCKGGHPEKSCVPAGTYELALHDSSAHPRTFALVNPALGVYHMPADIPAGAEGRTAVLIHRGNTTADSLACILVGRECRLIAERWEILESKDAYASFQAMVPWVEGHVLTVSYAPGIAP